MRCIQWIIIVLISVAPLTRAAVDPARVDEALKRAVEYLYQQQSGDNWERDGDFHHDQVTGQTALVVFALLSAGEDRQDPRIAKAIEYLQKTPAPGVYALCFRAQLWAALPQTPEVRRVMLQDAKTLQTTLIMDGHGKGLYPTVPGGKGYTNTSGQHGVLGAWAAMQAGVEIPRNYWQIVQAAWIKNQDAGGGWSFLTKPTPEHPVTPELTAVGVATLMMTQEALVGDAPAARGPVDARIDAGMKWLVENFHKVPAESGTPDAFPFATLYAYERVGIASGLKRFGDIDWYAKGAGWLLERQRRDGSWQPEFGRITSTSIAVLFLSRGRAPLVLNKLDYTPADAKKPIAWNQRPRDASNISRWIGRQLERELNWQIVGLSAPVSEWHDAPILYLGGNQALELDAESKQKLRAYIEQGGLVLGNADAGSRAFATSFRTLGQELFPSYEFRELPEDHVIYTNQQFQRSGWKSKPSVVGLSNGVRELMLLIPQADPARSWQARMIAGKDEHWQLASNIFLYAADQRNLLSRGQSHLAERDTKQIADRSLRLARIQYAGNWDPEPGGWRRLANILHNQHRTDLLIAPVDLAGGSLDGFKVAHLTGTSAITLDEAALSKLKQFVESGGTLLLDAAGGSGATAASLEEIASKLFPDVPLQPVPADHAMFRVPGLPALKTFNYRRYAVRTIPDLKDAPRIEMIQLENRPAVLLSREDLSNGLVGAPIDGVSGYDPQTATEITARILIHAALQPNAQ